MDIREYREWLAFTMPSGESVRPCADCTTDFCDEMAQEGRCLVWQDDQWVLGDLARNRLARLSKRDYHRLWRAGVFPTREQQRKKRMERAERAKGLAFTGMSKAMIARELGVCRQTVYKLLEMAA